MYFCFCTFFFLFSFGQSFQGSHMEIFSPFEGSNMACPVLLRAHTCFTAFYSLIFVGCAAQFFPYLQQLVAGCREKKQFVVVGRSRNSSSAEQTTRRQYFVIVSWRWYRKRGYSTSLSHSQGFDSTFRASRNTTPHHTPHAHSQQHSNSNSTHSTLAGTSY